MEYSYILKAYYKKPYQIFCEFEDGKSGILDITEYIDEGGVFSKLKDEQYAEQFQIIDGVLTWGQGDLDIAPETVYHKTIGAPLPAWMEID